MALLYPKPRQRYDRFRLNPSSPLYRGLVFAGLGGQGCVGSMVYPDSSPYHNHGTLTNMDAATDWVWDDELRRWANGRLTEGEWHIDLYFVPQLPISICAWANPVDFTRSHAIWSLADSSEEYTRYLLIDSISYSHKWLIWCDAHDAAAYSIVAQEGVWQHVYGYVSPGTRKVYVDGKHSGTSTTYKNPTGLDRNWLFRPSDSTPGLASPMLLSDTCIWSRALTPSEISAIADPSNVDLRVGGTPLLVPLRPRVFRVASVPTASGLASATGSAAVSLDAGGAATGLAALAGGTGLDLSVAGALARRVAISGGAGLLVSPSGRMSGLAGAAGKLETGLAVDAHLGGLVRLRGEAHIEFALRNIPAIPRPVQGRLSVRTPSGRLSVRTPSGRLSVRTPSGRLSVAGR